MASYLSFTFTPLQLCVPAGDDIRNNPKFIQAFGSNVDEIVVRLEIERNSIRPGNLMGVIFKQFPNGTLRLIFEKTTKSMSCMKLSMLYKIVHANYELELLTHLISAMQQLQLIL